MVLNEYIITNGMGSDDFEVEKTLKEELAKILKREECFWKKNQGKHG